MSVKVTFTATIKGTCRVLGDIQGVYHLLIIFISINLYYINGRDTCISPKTRQVPLATINVIKSHFKAVLKSTEI